MNIKLLGITDCLWTVLRVFLDIFVLSYIFKITEQNILAIGIYYLVSTTVMLITAVMIRKYLSKGLYIQIYRLGIIINGIFFIFLYVVGTQAGRYMAVCGTFLGLSIFLRGIGRIFLTYENVSESMMISFRGYLEFIKSFLKIITPLVLGLFLSKITDFINMFEILSVVIVVEYIFTYTIKKRKAEYKHNTEMKRFIKEFKGNELVRSSLYADYFRGLTILGVLPVVVTIYIIYLFKTTFNLGILTSVFSLIMLSVNLLFGRYCKYVYFVSVLKVSGTLTILLSLFFILFPSKITFVIYNIGLVSCMQLLWLLTEVNMFNIAGVKEIREKYYTEYFVMREIFCNLGKITGMAVLVVIGCYRYFDGLKYLLLILTVAIFLMVYYAIGVNNRLWRSGTQSVR